MNTLLVVAVVSYAIGYSIGYIQSRIRRRRWLRDFKRRQLESDRAFSAKYPQFKHWVE